VLRHLSNDVFRERPWLGRGTDENVWLHLLDDGQKIAMFFALPLLVLSRKRKLGRSELILLAL